MKIPKSLLPFAVSAAAVTASLTSHAAPTALVAYWDFNDASNATQSADVIKGNIGTFNATTAYTADLGGHSGSAGDRAVDFGAAAGATYVRVADASFFNLAAAADQVTVAFWLKHYDGVAGVSQPGASSTFWANSPSSNNGMRGDQAHVPWSDGNIYYDSAGCCGAGQRINKTINDLDTNFDWTQWHHFAFVKNGATKQIFIDGVLFLDNDPVTAPADPLPTDFTTLYIGSTGDGTTNLRGLVDDFAVWRVALTDTQIASLANNSKAPKDIVDDSDNDGMADAWETQYGLNVGSNDSAGDLDADGLTNLQEYLKGTKPNNPDTDGDGLKDGVETNTGVFVSATDTGTNPLVADTDSDGLLDGVETNTGTFVSLSNTGTSPLNADTDGDGSSDSIEAHFGTNPNDASSKPNITPGKTTLLAYFPFNNAAVADKAVDVTHNYSGDLINGAVYTDDAGGFSGKPGDRAVDFGSDSAGRAVQLADASFLNVGAGQDQIEIAFWARLAQTAATSAFWAESPSAGGRGDQAHVPWSDGTIYFDTTGSGTAGQRISQNVEAVLPGFDWTAWHHFAFVKNKNVKEIWIDGQMIKNGGADPFTPDFTRMWIGSGGPYVANIQGVLDDFAIFTGPLSGGSIKALASGKYSPLDLNNPPDADGDGMDDIWEFVYGTKLGVNDANEDPDSDGSTNLQEYQAGTDPKNPDTDGDGLKDGVETNTGTWVDATHTGTNPLSADSDGDGLPDATEKNTGVFVDANDPGTNPNKADTDDDGLGDAAEISSVCGSNPNDKTSICVDVSKLNLLAYWSFDDASDPAQSLDKVASAVGLLTNGAVFTDDKGGASGAAGDRAVDMAADDGSGTLATGWVDVADAAFLNKGSLADHLSVVFWEKLVVIANSSAFWVTSPTQDRAFQAHVPWGEGTIYFDSAGGCCDAATQRVSKGIGAFDPNFDWTAWHHFAFVKDGGTKRIFVDGQLFLEASNTGLIATDIGALAIGSQSAGAGSMRGMVDEWAAYATALTQAEAAQLAAGTKPDKLTRVAASTKLHASGNVASGYAEVAGATIDEGAKKITVAIPGTNQYYRINAATAVTIKSIIIVGGNVVIEWQ